MTRNVQLLPIPTTTTTKQDNSEAGGKSGAGGENPNGIMENYHFLTGEDLYDTAKANGLK